MGGRSSARSAHINVRMTPGERESIEDRARRAGMPPSTFMRAAALNIDHEPVRVADAEELRAMRTDLKRIGTNLNQAVRALNSHGPDPVTLSLLENSITHTSEAASQISGLVSRAAERE